MPRKDDYLPRREADLVDWTHNFTGKLAVKAGLWGIPPEELDALQSAFTAFKDLHGQVNSPLRNSVMVAAKNTAKKNLTGLIRAMANFRLKNPLITDADRRDLGLRVPDPTLSSIPAPGSRPAFSFRVKGIRQVQIVFWDEKSGKKARPYGVIGALIFFVILDGPPVDLSALTRSALATRSPYTLEFTEEDRGKRVYAALCWQNGKGGQGSWSEIQSAIVP